MNEHTYLQVDRMVQNSQKLGPIMSETSGTVCDQLPDSNPLGKLMERTIWRFTCLDGTEAQVECMKFHKLITGTGEDDYGYVVWYLDDAPEIAFSNAVSSFTLQDSVVTQAGEHFVSLYNGDVIQSSRFTARDGSIIQAEWYDAYNGEDSGTSWLVWY